MLPIPFLPQIVSVGLRHRYFVLSAAALAFSALLAAPSPVAAQGLVTTAPSRYFVNVNWAFQSSDLSLADEATFPVYQEPATVGSAYDVDLGAGFDIGGGAYVWKNVGVGLAFSRFGGGEAARTTASLPHPLLFNAPRTAEVSAHHAERAVHLQALWTLPVNERVDVTVAAGPSFYTVQRDRVTSVAFSEGAEPFNTVAVTGTTTTRQSESAVGFNIGVDGVYMLTRGVGAGLTLRYASASMDFPGATGGVVDVDAGGLQVAMGLRLRF